MVRKRTRKYDSDDNDSDSDVDFDVEHHSRPAPKKYSLRERKRAPLLTDDFDYYGLDEEEGAAKKQSSDDEDFEVEADVNGARSYFEPEPDADPQNSEGTVKESAEFVTCDVDSGLIDFEDIIRADIVVNRNKIDYDNLIQKTEIKLTQPKKKRGRKPKNRPEENVTPKEESESNSACENQLDTLEQLEKEENNEKKEESCTSDENKAVLQPEVALCEGQGGLPNGDLKKNGDESDPLLLQNTNSVETVTIKPPEMKEIKEKVNDEEKIVEEEDDDVIVLGELKHDVIVLDD